jgi:outer membrane protein TolC
VLLTQLVAADAGLDPFVQALCAADCALDDAQTSLAALLGLPDPDPEDMPTDPAMPQQMNGASLSFLRAQLETGRA